MPKCNGGDLSECSLLFFFVRNRLVGSRAGRFIRCAARRMGSDGGRRGARAGSWPPTVTAEHTGTAITKVRGSPGFNPKSCVAMKRAEKKGGPEHPMARPQATSSNVSRQDHARDRPALRAERHADADLTGFCDWTCVGHEARTDPPRVSSSASTPKIAGERGDEALPRRGNR